MLRIITLGVIALVAGLATTGSVAASTVGKGTYSI